MMPQVDIAIDAAIGMRLLLFSPSLERLAAWRSRMNSEAAKATGFAYGAYGRLKFAMVTERLAERIADLGGQEVVAVRASLWRHLNAGGVNKPEWDAVKVDHFLDGISCGPSDVAHNGAVES